MAVEEGMSTVLQSVLEAHSNDAEVCPGARPQNQGETCAQSGCPNL